MLWILLGFTHSGKSYLGKRLADRLEKDFLDTDELLCHVLDQSKQKTCRELYHLHGAEHFRNTERSILEGLQGQTQCIVASGGGSILHPHSLSMLSQEAEFVFLDASWPLLRERMHALPAYSKCWSELEREFHRRRQHYLDHAQHCIQVEGEDAALADLAALITGVESGQQ